MKHSRASTLFLILVSVVLVFTYIGHAHKSNAQDPEKSLNIARYPDEPLELVDLKIGQNSVKSGIKSKVKNNRSQSVLDDVKFRENDDWSRNVKIRLRNISGRPIYSLSVSLFFQHTSSRTAFEIPLRRAENRDLKKQPLQPGDEIDLEVKDKDFNETMTMIRQYGLEPSGLPVILDVRSALFGDDFGWFGGTLMRRDPNNPQKWDAVDKPAPPGASQSPASCTHCPSLVLRPSILITRHRDALINTAISFAIARRSKTRTMRSLVAGLGMCSS